MKIIHRITEVIDAPIQAHLQALGIRANCGFTSLELAEDHPAWPELERLVKIWGAVDIPRTEFTDAELNETLYLKLNPQWHLGYPQPENDFGYLAATFEESGLCRTCGIGKQQHAPFRFAREPAWGRRHVLQLNWVFDVYFCQAEVWRRVFKEFGIESRIALHHRSGEPLESVIQLVPQGSVPFTRTLADRTHECCKVCRRTKYNPIVRGFFPRPEVDTNLHLFTSVEEFGSCASAHHAVLISQNLYRAIAKANLKGVSFMAVK